jgi:hypothetical protein
MLLTPKLPQKFQTHTYANNNNETEKKNFSIFRKANLLKWFEGDDEGGSWSW